MAEGFAAGEFPAELVTCKYPLPNFSAALRGKEPVRIVALGSSSTAGREDVVPYPPRLEMYLRRKYANPRIDVVNRGRGGEEAIEQLLRFDADVVALAPSLLIWQVGTNAVFHKYDLSGVAPSIAEGLARLKGRPVDVVLMDPQYVPAMLLDDRADASDRIVSLIAGVADKAKVTVFRRWALMRHWHVQTDIPFDRMIDPADPDRLHQSDWSTQRLSVALCEAISKAPAAAS